MKSFVPLLIFSLGAPLVLSLASLLLFLTSPATPPPPPPKTPAEVLSASTEEDILYPNFLGTFGTADARVHIIRNYLKKYSSPLEPFAQTLVNASDKNSLDYRLLVAIAQQESNLCKKIPDDSHNCWGFGIYGDKITRFDNYPQAIDTVAETLKKKYVDKGLNTPEEIMAKYAPPSLEKGGPWAKGVNRFMTDLE
jgi:hypothetical protein